MLVIRKTQSNTPATFLVTCTSVKNVWSENFEDAKRFANLKSVLVLIERLSVLPECRHCELHGVFVEER